MSGENLPIEGNREELIRQERDALLAKIERILEHMLLLAEVSAGTELDVDRDMLQRTMQRLQARLDRIADELDQIGDGQ